MKIRSTFLPLIASGLMSLSVTSFAVPTTTKLMQIAGLTLAITTNSPLIDAARGDEEQSTQTNLRVLKKKGKCDTTPIQDIDCNTACTNVIPSGTELKSCTDSDAVNTYTCTYKEISGANCLSCPTDDETGLWFESKNIRSGDPCMVTCVYSNPDRSYEAACTDLCLDKNPYNDLNLVDCSLTGTSVKSLVCDYEGVKEASTYCGNCPTDDDIGNGYWFKSKSPRSDDAFCQTSCRYINDGT